MRCFKTRCREKWPQRHEVEVTGQARKFWRQELWNFKDFTVHVRFSYTGPATSPSGSGLVTLVHGAGLENPRTWNGGPPRSRTDMRSKMPLLFCARNVVDGRHLEMVAKGIQDRARELPRGRGFEINSVICWAWQSQRVLIRRLRRHLESNTSQTHAQS